MNTKLKKYLNSIIDIDEDKMKEKRLKFAIHHTRRCAYLEQLRREGIKGKAYSDAVVKYDKELIGIPVWS